MSKNRKFIFITIGIIGIIALLSIAYLIISADSRMIKKQLDLGNKYLTEQNFDMAIVAFDAALQIDPCIKEGYVGKAEAYIGKAGSGNDYEVTVENLSKAYSTYGDAIEVFNGNENIADGEALVEQFKNLQNETVSQMEKAISDYVEYLVEQKDIDKIKELKDKYGTYVTYDFDAAIKRIEDAIEREAVLLKIYNALSVEDYEAADLVYNSQEYKNVCKTVDEGYFYAVFDGSKDTGKGAAIYKSIPQEYDYSRDSYMYYGDIVDGICEGEGVCFTGTKPDYKVYRYYRGEFSNNLPNGKITGTEIDQGVAFGELATSVAEGNMVDGLWDGDAVEDVMVNNGGNAHYDYMSFNKGIGVVQKTPSDCEFPVLKWRYTERGGFEAIGFSRNDTSIIYGVFDDFP